MHKTVIALAIAGMAAAPAFADSNVTIYGTIDYGYGMRSGNNGLGTCGTAGSLPASCPKQEFVSGVDTDNRLGFKGSEDVGNGNKVIFELEMGFFADTGENSLPNNGISSGSGLFRNHSWVGLTGEWGTLIGGRVDGSRYSLNARYDPFGGHTVATLTSLNGQVTRADNAVAFVTPNFEGLYAIVAYTSSLVGQEATHNTGDTRLFVLPQLNYVNGPLSVTFNFEHANVHNSAGNAMVRVYDLGASYDLGIAKVMALFDRVKTDDDTGLHPGGVLDWEYTWWVGAVVPVTEKTSLRGVYGRYKDQSAAQDSCQKWGFGGEHFLSKRTNFYLDYGGLAQRQHGQCSIYYNAYTASVDAGAGGNTGGVGTRGIDVGMVHRF